jgi:hypothetical protein
VTRGQLLLDGPILSRVDLGDLAKVDSSFGRV